MSYRTCATLVGIVFACAAQANATWANDSTTTADAILAATGIQGGLVVQLGVGDGHLAAEFGRQECFIVQALEKDASRVQQARQLLAKMELYGRVSVEQWTAGSLPYVDNSVNLIVVNDTLQLADDELLRVLVPQGAAYVREGDHWRNVVKPERDGVDEWTHFLHDATANPVGEDLIVGPPRHLQWTAGPRHSRSHEYTPSIQAVVSAQGRVFYIADQGSIATLKAPAEWALIARDAYNGVQLWQRPIEKWFSHIYGWTQGPRQLQRRLVAAGDSVFVTLGYHAPLTQLDAATGQTVRVYPDTLGADEVMWDDGVLLVVVSEVNKARVEAYEQWEAQIKEPNSPLHLRDTRNPVATAFRQVENRADRSLLAFDTESGDLLWSMKGGQAQGLKPLSVRICNKRVYYEQRGKLWCCKLRNGEVMWSKQADPLRAVSARALVCVSKRKISLLSPEDGATQWTQPVALASIRDVMLIDGSLWMGGGKPYDSGNSKYTGPLWGPYFAVQRDLSTGEIVNEITAENPKHHHRCYESKATPNFIVGGRRGTELLDLHSGDYLWHSWARGTCRYGVMPCNGMIYVPPHACGCYITVKLMGFNALAPASSDDSALPIGEGVEQGPAFGQPVAVSASVQRQWPTFRGDMARSGYTTDTIPVPLTARWQVSHSSAVTPPTIAGDQVYVAVPDQHEVRAIDLDSGEVAWKYVAAGRVDSPPTIVDGRVYFGCRDGHVYALRADDGELLWRFRGLRALRRIVADGQVESAAPIHGSVLAHDGSLYCVAGRSSYLDGGLTLYQLDALTGVVQNATVLYSPDPETGQQPEQYGPNSMPGARSDILAGDDNYLYLRDATFEFDGKEVEQPEPHLFTLTDYLDDSCAHRSYWIFGTKPSISTGCSGRERDLLYGRVLVFDDETVFGYGRENVHWSNEFEDGKYRVFARRQDEKIPHWAKNCPVHVDAMLLAGDTLFAAGAGAAPGKFVDLPVSPTPLVVAYRAADGRELATIPLEAGPVLNGLAAANEQLVLSLANGDVVCLGTQ